MSLSRKEQKNKNRRGTCKDCQNAVRMASGSYNTWHNSPNGRKWKARYEYEYRLKKHFGIDLKQYNIIKKSQNGRCKICLATKSKGWSKKLVVDHCHITGKIRGLLCSLCNVGLGSFKDNQKSLIMAAKYLKEHQK